VVEVNQDGFASQRSDYDAVGGGAAVSSVVDLFYRLVLADPQLTGYFEGTDLSRLKRHQVQLVSQVMGGPVTYEGPELAAAHAGRGISGADFANVVRHLIAALEAHEVSQDIIGRVVEELAATKSAVVSGSVD
jgi:hemoglobin